MGINTFSFDGESSGTYGVYISEGASFNAPARSVEMVEIPGRNGAYALDRGKFDNVEVTYRVFIDGDNRADFSGNLSDLRNWLGSKVGYCRLTDTYNPDEYRMAIYKSGLEVEETTSLSGEFDVVFECKPQRWLTSGETAVSVSSGSTLTNPTRFNSSPLLQIDGYGKMYLNDSKIELLQGLVVGEIAVSEPIVVGGSYTGVRPDTTFAVTGDSIYTKGSRLGGYYGTIIANKTIESYTVNSGTWWDAGDSEFYNDTFIPRITLSKDIRFQYGTSAEYSDTVTFTLTFSDSTTTTLSFTVTVDYGVDVNVSFLVSLPTGFTDMTGTVFIETLFLYSSQPASGIYIDLEIGEAYMVDGGSVASVNNVAILPANLPVLKPGANIITYDNTITNFKVTPRWWKV